MQREDLLKPEMFRLNWFSENNFKRYKCQGCGNFFWSQIERKKCGEPPCEDYAFIGKPFIPKKYNWKKMREMFIDFFESENHEPIGRYPVVARWKPDTFYVGASIYAFQPWVLNKTIEPPANPLVMSQPSVRFGDLDNVGVTGRHMSIFEMMAHHAFNYPNKKVYWKEETADYCYRWLNKLKIRPEKIVYKENLWEGGGNAGPCFEIIIDGNEVATLVFMEFEARNGEYRTMDMKVVDTGYGLERHVWGSTGSKTIYDGIYPKLIEWLRKKVGKEDRETMHRIYQIADHSRSIMFILGDGVVPSNVQEGYLARLMIRRTLRNLEDLNLENSLGEIIEKQVKEHKDIYPEFQENENDILKMIDVEQRKYKDTLKRGELLVKKMVSERRRIDEKTLIELYDSHGILPRDVKRFVPQINVDLSDIDTKIAARKSEAKVPQEKKTIDVSGVRNTRKLYYENEKLFETDAKIVKVGENFVVLDQTIFYPRGGGQEPDHGEIGGNKVYDVESVGNVIVHFAEKPKLKEGQKVKIKIDKERRLALMRHHTATHILTGTTRKILGNHVWQAGTKKEADRAHLDITHYESLTDEQIKEIQDLANEIIKKNIKTGKAVLPRTIAERKYGFRLYQGGAVPGKDFRVISINDFDHEACGGTHLDNTADAEEIFIFNTKKIQDGVVRLEFVAGKSLAERMKREISEKNRREKESFEKKMKEIEEEKKRLKEIKKKSNVLYGINYIDTEDMKELKFIGGESVKKDPAKFSILVGKGIVYGIAGEKCRTNIENKVKEIAKAMGGSAGGRDREFSGGGPLKEKGKEIYKKFKLQI